MVLSLESHFLTFHVPPRFALDRYQRHVWILFVIVGVLAGLVSRSRDLESLPWDTVQGNTTTGSSTVTTLQQQQQQAVTFQQGVMETSTTSTTTRIVTSSTTNLRHQTTPEQHALNSTISVPRGTRQPLNSSLTFVLSNSASRTNLRPPSLASSLSSSSSDNSTVQLKRGRDEGVVRDVGSAVAGHHRHHHCAIVTSSLWGNNTERRQMYALDWYRYVTVNSIRIAANHSDMAVVMVLLNTKNSYQNKTVKDTDDLGGDTVKFFQIRDSTGAGDVYSAMKVLAAKRECRYMSVVRIDADDILLAGAFQNIEMGWRDVLMTNDCLPASGPCKHALVSGIPFRDWSELILDPVSADGSTMECSGVNKKAIMPPGNDLDFVAAPGGLTVTMPVEFWLRQFRGTESAVSHNFRKLVTIVANKLQAVNVTTHVQGVLGNHSFWVQTPLSGHYSFRRKKVNCTLTYLRNLLGQDIGDMLWENRDYVPKLTHDEWASNVYFDRKDDFRAKMKNKNKGGWSS